MSPSIDEILSELESSEEAETTEEAPAADEGNSAIKQIRESQKTWERKARDLGKELKVYKEKVSEFEGAQRRTTAEGVFKEIGLSEKQAGLFLKNHEGEVTADAIKQFVTDYGLADLSEETGGTTEEKSQGFTPGGTGSAVEPKTYSLEEAKALDPAKLDQLMAAGRIKLDKLPGNQ